MTRRARGVGGSGRSWSYSRRGGGGEGDRWAPAGIPAGPASALRRGVGAPMALAERAVWAAPSLPTLGVGRGMRAPSTGLGASNAQTGGRAGGCHQAGEAGGKES